MDYFYAVDETTTVPIDRVKMLEEENALLRNQIADLEEKLKKADEKALKNRKVANSLYVVLIVLLLIFAAFMFLVFFRF